MTLTREELERYNRHLLLPEIGVAGQQRLKDASVLLVGAGGLGSPLALYLAAAGLGRIGIVDFDVVDVTNLQRQILHGTSDVGRPKVESARDRLHDVLKLLRDIKASGDVKYYACSSSMAICGLKQEDLIPEIDEVRGLPAFLLEDVATADKVLTF